MKIGGENDRMAFLLLEYAQNVPIGYLYILFWLQIHLFHLFNVFLDKVAFGIVVHYHLLIFSAFSLNFSMFTLPKNLRKLLILLLFYCKLMP